MLPATTSSSTSTRMRGTLSSLWVSDHSGAPTVPGWVCRVQSWGQRALRCAQAHPATPTVFIYSMPGYKCSIRERMLYSSCKSRLLDSVEQDFQLEIAKKVGVWRPPPSGTQET